MCVCVCVCVVGFTVHGSSLSLVSSTSSVYSTVSHSARPPHCVHHTERRGIHCPLMAEQKGLNSGLSHYLDLKQLSCRQNCPFNVRPHCCLSPNSSPICELVNEIRNEPSSESRICSLFIVHYCKKHSIISYYRHLLHIKEGIWASTLGRVP